MAPPPLHPTPHYYDRAATLSVPDPFFDTDGSDADGSKPDLHQKSHGLQVENSTSPVLLHKVKDTCSILSLIVNDGRIFAGTQGGEILVHRL